MLLGFRNSSSAMTNPKSAELLKMTPDYTWNFLLSVEVPAN